MIRAWVVSFLFHVVLFVSIPSVWSSSFLGFSRPVIQQRGNEVFVSVEPFANKLAVTQKGTHSSRGRAESMILRPDVVAQWGNRLPEYPEEAIERGAQGRVLLDVVFDSETRSATSVEMVESSGSEILDDASVEAATHWKIADEISLAKDATMRFRVPIEFLLVD